jgi:hypothetical protein
MIRREAKKMKKNSLKMHLTEEKKGGKNERRRMRYD